MNRERDIEKLQDAIGGISEEYIEEAHNEETQSSNASQGYNSWTMLATNTERRDKIKKGKGINSYTTQRISVAVACIILALVVIFPKVKSLGLFGDAKNSAEEITAEESSGSAPEEAGTEESYGSDVKGDEKETMEDAEAMAPSESVDGDDMTMPPDGNFTAQEGAAFMLTAAEWKDNDNWPFFTNLVTSGTIEFPSYGIDPRNRVKVTVTDESGTLLEGEQVTLLDEAGNQLWTAKSNKNGVSYLFYNYDAKPAKVVAAGVEKDLLVSGEAEEGSQAPVPVSFVDDVEVSVSKTASEKVATQVMFIVDTTGSMGDELAYLQKDFASIAEDTFDGNTWFSANFYRDEEDEYVTKTNEFTQNLAAVQNQFNGEFAEGGGDTPEAVARILAETITNNGEWRDDCNKVAFLVFDAPPHYGTDDEIRRAVETAADKGIHIVPVVSSNSERATELFGRALAICTDGTYVFLTDDSGIGGSHLEPIVGSYTVELLHDVIVRIINSYK